MTLEKLKELLEAGKFDHATYREHGTIWEGLYIYEKCANEDGGFRGYRLFGCFNVGPSAYSGYAERKALANQAYELVRHTGVSVGSYGQG